MSAPVSATDSGSIAFTVAAVPTGMNAGVSTAPRSRRRMPERAAPLLATISKANSLMRCPSAQLSGSRRPEQETGVAIGIEAVALGNGFRVSRLHGFDAAKRADEHEEGRARQVEIRQKNVDRLEAIAGRDEQRGLAAKGSDDPIIAGRGFQSARGRGSDGDDASARGAGRVQGLRG